MAEKKSQKSRLKSSDNLGESRKNSPRNSSLFKNKDSSNEPSAEKKIFIAKNLKLTAIGTCFVPPQYNICNPDVSQIPTEHLSQSTRADYKLPSKGPYSIAVIGEHIISEEFCSEIKHHCSDDPTIDEIKSSDFFLFLVHLDKYYSLTSMQEKIEKVFKIVKYLSSKSLVIGISHGKVCNRAIPAEDYQNFLVNFQIPSYTFCPINRERKSYTLRNITAVILESCSLSSSKSLIKWGLSCPVDNEDMVLS
ncbi:hypothetical protein Avbf_11527 [Armadillidium vulgare]|nr:hypothetical protein Avbf_11527 [Armadillidium vulgare]